MSETNAAVSMGTQAMSALSQTTKVTIDAVAALLAKRDLDGLRSVELGERRWNIKVQCRHPKNHAAGIQKQGKRRNRFI